MPRSAFHYVAFRTIAHATEDVQRVEEALRFVLGSAGDDKELARETAEGHHKNPILILSTELKNKAPIEGFFRRLADEPGLLDTLSDQMERRLDDDGVFYMRFAKQDAFKGRLVLAQEEDAVMVRSKVAAFPAKRENASRVLREFLDRFGGP